MVDEIANVYLIGADEHFESVIILELGIELPTGDD
jgi:hypothetical protein